MKRRTRWKILLWILAAVIVGGLIAGFVGVSHLGRKVPQVAGQEGRR